MGRTDRRGNSGEGEAKEHSRAARLAPIEINAAGGWMVGSIRDQRGHSNAKLDLGQNRASGHGASVTLWLHRKTQWVA